jgi:60 kDa SS-A/Ro ribonucleoprotein
MGRFNVESAGTKTVNYAGGEAYKTNPKFELVSILLTSMVQDQFYRKAGDTIEKVKALIPQVGPLFAAKASLLARNEFGMRSITHVVASEIAKTVKGEKWTKHYYAQVFRRPDDMLETVAAYAAGGSIHPLPGALKKGINLALEKFSEYQLAKYRGEGKAIKLIDLINLTHPKGGGKLTKLMKGELKSVNTWETKLTQSGQNAESDEEKAELKDAAWKELLSEKQLGYLALIRNARNIIQQSPESIHWLCEQLQNEEAIKKSLVFPYQLFLALAEVGKINPPREVLIALSKALDLSLANVPKFEGKTLICLDNSGSMKQALNTNGSVDVSDIAALFASVLYKVNDANLMVFSDHAKYVSPNPLDTLSSIMVKALGTLEPRGTDFNAIFKEIGKVKYDRIVVLSDMQGWIGYHAPTGAFNQYCQETGASPYVYSFDLAGYGTLQLPESKVFCLAGFSDKTFDVMKQLEQDKNALIKKIEAVNIEGVK